MTSQEFATEFIRRLNNDEIKKDYLPDNSSYIFTEESVQEELKQYNEFLQSDFWKNIYANLNIL